jgi:hypothetical protein
MPKQFSAEEDAQLVELRMSYDGSPGAGSIKEIARATGRPYKSVWSRLNFLAEIEEGLRAPRGFYWRRADDDELIRMRAAGLSRKEIAAAMWRSERAVASRLWRLRRAGRAIY